MTMTTNTQVAGLSDDLSALLASIEEAEEAEATNVAPMTVTAAPVETDILDENDLLADLADLRAEVAPAPAVMATSELDEDLLADLETTVARAEAYSNQSDSAPVTSTAPVATAESPSAARKPRTPKAASTPRAPRSDLAAMPDDVFTEIVGVAPDKAAMLAKRPAQVKVAEKFDNLFQALNAGKEPSRYVVTGFKLLTQAKTMTSADLVSAFKAEGLGDGTARSQTGQILALFATVNIALRSGQALTIREDSAIATKLAAIIK